MEHHLVVIRPFLNFVRGDIITEVTKINEILAMEYKRFVTRVTSSRTKG